MYGYVYKTTNILNNRFYVGQKKAKNFNPNYYGSGIVLATALQKYGKDNFKIEILFWAETKEELNKIEEALIAENLNNPLCYNIAKGGDGGDTTSYHPNKENIVRLRTEKLKEWHDSLSLHEKTIRGQKISQAKKGKTNGHLGLKHSPETIQKIKQKNKDFDRANNKEWKSAHSQAMAKRKGKPLTKKYKPVIVNGIEFVSIKHAMEYLGIKHRAVFYKKMKEGIIEVIYK